MSKLLRKLAILVFALALAVTPLLSAGAAQPRPQSTSVAGVYNNGSDTPAPLKVSKDFIGKGGNANEKVDVIVQLNGDPVAKLYKETLTRQGAAAASREDYQVAHSNQLKQLQAPVVAAASRVGKVTGQLTVLYNGVAVTGVARRDIAALYNLPGVVDVHVIGNYKVDLAYSVPFVGGSRCAVSSVLTGATSRYR